MLIVKPRDKNTESPVHGVFPHIAAFGGIHDVAGIVRVQRRICIYRSFTHSTFALYILAWNLAAFFVRFIFFSSNTFVRQNIQRVYFAQTLTLC